MDRIPDRGAPAVLVLLGLALLLPGLFALGPVESTDARYLEISREMLETGDYWLPTLAGVPHLDKPPATYWTGAAGMRVLGVSPGAGRLLQQLAVLATALVVWSWGRRWCGREAALTAALLFVTSGLVYVASRGLATDHLQLLLLTPALALLFDASTGRRRAGRSLVGGFALLGLAMWVKGPVALMVGLGVWLPFLALMRARVRVSRRALLLAGVVFFAIGVGWYAWLVGVHPELISYFVDEQLVGRVKGSTGHPESLLYLPRGWLAGLLPWTFLAVLALARSVARRDGSRDPVDVFLVCWAVAPLVLFSLFSSKLQTYLLPCVPGAAWAVARAAGRGALEDRAARGAEVLGAAVVALGAAGGLAFALVPALWGHARMGRLLPPEAGPSWLAVLGLAAALALGAALALPRVRALAAPRRLALLALATGLLEASGFVLVVPRVFTFRETGQLAAQVPDARFVELHTFKAGPLFYVGDLDRIFLAEQRRFEHLPMETPRAHAVQLTGADVQTMLAEPRPTFCLARAKSASPLLGVPGVRMVQDLGRWVLLANRSAAAALPAAAEASSSP